MIEYIKDSITVEASLADEKYFYGNTHCDLSKEGPETWILGSSILMRVTGQQR